jgi:hypothetical protein
MIQSADGLVNHELENKQNKAVLSLSSISRAFGIPVHTSAWLAFLLEMLFVLSPSLYVL